MAKPIGKTFVEIDLDAKKFNKGVVDVKTTTKKKLTEIEKAWKGMGKKSEATIDKMKAKINADYDTIKRHASSTAADILRAEKAKNDKITRLNKQQFGEQKSLLDKAKQHWVALAAGAVAAYMLIRKAIRLVITAIKQWINLAGVQELAEINLAAALKAAGKYTDELNIKYQDFASSIQKVTKYGDEQVLTLMALMKNLGVSTDKVEEATKMAIGLATATGRDVQSMAMYIALAQQGEFTMLRRYIPALRSTTDATEQMRIITEFAARGFKVAQSQTASFAIGLVQLKNLWGDLKEKLGDFIIKNKFVLDLMQRTKMWLIEVGAKVDAWRNANQELIDQKMEEYLDTSLNLLTGIAEAVKLVYSGYSKVIKLLKDNQSVFSLPLIGQVAIIKRALIEWGLYNRSLKETSDQHEIIRRKIEKPLDEVIWIDLAKLSEEFQSDLAIINYHLEGFRLNSVAAWEAYKAGQDKADMDAYIAKAKEMAAIKPFDWEQWIIPPEINQTNLGTIQDFNTQYAALGKSRYDLERENLEKQKALWEAAGIEKDRINRLYADKSIEIARAEQQAKLAIYANAAGMIANMYLQIAQAGGEQSKAAFKNYQAFATIQAGITAAMLIIKTLAEPLLPFPSNVIMAGIMGALAMKQIQMIQSAQPPSFDQGGVSSARGVYQTGDIEEAHIPLEGGKVPVNITGREGTTIVINMPNPTFQDIATQRRAFAMIATEITERVAPGAIVRSYHNDGRIRSLIRSRA